MTDLIVDRLHARAMVNGPDDARVRSLLADLAGRRLEEALASAAPPPGEWCVRRLDISLTLDHFASDATLSRRWARAVTQALTMALADGGPEVVHYARPSDAVADLIAELALDRAERAWAWRAVGALTSADPDPAREPAGAALAALERDHGSAVHVLSAAVRVAGLPAVHRLLGAPGWQRAAAAVLAAAGQPARWLQVEPPVGNPGGSVPGGGGAIVAGIVARSPFAEAWRRSRLRPSPATARAWAVLAAAEAEPALLRRPVAAQVLAALPGAIDPTAVSTAGYALAADPPTADTAALDNAAALDRAAADSTAANPSSGDPRVVELPAVEPAALDQFGADQATTPAIAVASAPEVTTDAATTSGPGGRRRPDTDTDAGPNDVPVQDQRPADRTHLPLDPRRSTEDRPAPAQPARTGDPVPDHEAQGCATVWGGLVHLFTTAAAAGLPDAAFADEELAGWPASWILFHLAHAMTGNAPDGLVDPATRAVAGLPPKAPVPAPEPSAGQRVQLARIADRWARVTAERLGQAGQVDSPQAVVARLARRSGTVHHSNGWIEFRLQLSDVDLDVRRAGLDLDPGFVAWLGAVVVIRYG